MAKRRVSVQSWIQEALTDPDKGGACNMLSLVLMKGLGQEEIHTKEISGPQDAAALANFFVDKATGYAQDLPGIQTFKLLAFYGTKEPMASFPFTVFEGALTAGDAAPWSRHEPSATGLMAQLMKHNETIMQMMVGIVQTHAVAALQRETEHRREQAEMNLIMRDVLLSLRKEENDMRLGQLRFARETGERELLGKALPSILNYVLGREVLPESHAKSELLDSILATLTPDDLQMLVAMGKVKPEQAALLANYANVLREEAEKRAAMLKRGLPPEEGPLTNGKEQQSP